MQFSGFAVSKWLSLLPSSILRTSGQLRKALASSRFREGDIVPEPMGAIPVTSWTKRGSLGFSAHKRKYSRLCRLCASHSISELSTQSSVERRFFNAIIVLSVRVWVVPVLPLKGECDRKNMVLNA